MVVTLQLISTLRIFSQVYVMTNGGPAASSSSPIYYMYTVAIVRELYGYASAIAIMLFVVILARHRRAALRPPGDGVMAGAGSARRGLHAACADVPVWLVGMVVAMLWGGAVRLDGLDVVQISRAT